jgi:hypothetical protein
VPECVRPYVSELRGCGALSISERTLVEEQGSRLLCRLAARLGYSVCDSVKNLQTKLNDPRLKGAGYLTTAAWNAARDGALRC